LVVFSKAAEELAKTLSAINSVLNDEEIGGDGEEV